MERNKPFIVCFRHIAFQLVPEQGKFRTIFAEQFVPVERNVAKEDTPTDVIPDEDTLTAEDQLLSDTPSEDIVEIDDNTDAMELPYIYVRNLNAKMHTSYFPDSSVHYKVELKNGFKDGSFTEYYDSGKEKMTGKFSGDKRDGVWRLYDPEGKLMMRRRYDNGEIRTEKVRD
jgi:antitoxin component YwqK of YwqJK toxin-antitoxin module